MERRISKETFSLLSQNETIYLSEIPDDLLNAWIIGIANKPDYIYERDFIVNIFNEIYEGYKERQGIIVSEDDSEREACRIRFEELLSSEEHRRLSGEIIVDDCDPFEFIAPH